MDGCGYTSNKSKATRLTLREGPRLLFGISNVEFATKETLLVRFGITSKNSRRRNPWDIVVLEIKQLLYQIPQKRHSLPFRGLE
jgi:hypothetical protein